MILSLMTLTVSIRLTMEPYISESICVVPTPVGAPRYELHLCGT